MIATTIGRTFLNAYNEKTKQSLTAKEFFEREYLPLFFDHPKYMMTGGNSPLENPKISWKKGITPTKEERKDRIRKTITKIESSSIDASVAIGYPASERDEFSQTSCMVTDLSFDVSPNSKYLSWIGSGFGLYVKGTSLFFDNVEILLDIYKGWKTYREILNDSSLQKLKGMQIEAWNTQWLNYLYSEYYKDNFDFNSLINLKIFRYDLEGVCIDTIPLSRLLFALSKRYGSRELITYMYSLGKSNTTLGFFPLKLKEVNRLIEYYIELFGENSAIDDKNDYELLFGSNISLICELGAIGLQALEPKDLRKNYFGKDSNLKLIKPEFKEKTGESDEDRDKRKKTIQEKDRKNIVTYRTYKTWLLAMITKNKEESLEYTQEVAEALHEYKSKAKGRERINLLESELLSAKSKKIFLDSLTTLIKDVDESSLKLFKELRDRVHLMTSEDFGYFVVLLKFDYAYQERELNN